MDVGKLFSSPPTFETARLRIRRLELSDAADYFELASDPDVSAETVWDRHHSIEETVDYLIRVNQRFDMKQAIHWGIVEKASGKLIGRTGLIHVDPVHEKPRLVMRWPELIGVWGLSRKRRGKSCGTLSSKQDSIGWKPDATPAIRGLSG